MKNYFDGIFAQGIFLGAYFVLLFILIFNVEIGTLLSSVEFLAAIFGAFIGGLFVLLVSLYSINEDRKKHEEFRHREIKDRSLQLFTKVTDINSNICNMYDVLEVGFEEYREARNANPNEPNYLCLYVGEQASKRPTIHLEAIERTFLLDWGKFELFNRITLLEKNHNLYVQAFNRYSSERKLIMNLYEADSFSGSKASRTLSLSEIKKWEVELIPLDDFLNNLWKELDSYRNETFSTYDDLTKIIVEKTDLEIVVEKV